MTSQSYAPTILGPQRIVLNFDGTGRDGHLVERVLAAVRRSENASAETLRRLEYLPHVQTNVFRLSKEFACAENTISHYYPGCATTLQDSDKAELLRATCGSGTPRPRRVR